MAVKPTPVIQDIANFFLSLPEPKCQEIEILHRHILALLPNEKLWFDKGVNSEGKVVTNPTIGYGSQTITYANGSSKEFFILGLSANATGISIYLLGLTDKTYLTQIIAPKIGKAKVTGYCIRLKKTSDIHLHVLEEAIAHRFQQK